MGRKVTLQELASNNTTSTNENIDAETIKKNVEPTTSDIKSTPTKNLKEVSASDIRSTLPEKEVTDSEEV